MIPHIHTDSKHTQNYASIQKYVWGGKAEIKIKAKAYERESDEIERKTERVGESETERQTDRQREIHC